MDTNKGENKMVWRIGFMGKAGRGQELPDYLLKIAREIGASIAEKKHVLITGACMGTPFEAAVGARGKNGVVIAYTPAANMKEHLAPPISYPVPPEGVKLEYCDTDKNGRIPIMIGKCDAVIVCSGTIGSSIEGLMAFQNGLVTGCISGTGGAADALPSYIASLGKKTGAVVIQDSDHKSLVISIINELEKRAEK